MTRAVELLVSRGHRLGDVLDVYTMDQFATFFKVAMAGKVRDSFELSQSVRAGYGASKEQWVEYERSIQKTIDGLFAGKVEKATPTMTKEEAKELANILSGKVKVKKKRY